MSLADFFGRKRVAEAEQRAAVAEEHAAVLARELDWMRVQLETALEGRDRSVKMMANVGFQMQYGIVPFPEVASLPERDSPAKSRDFLDDVVGDLERPRDVAFADFVEREKENWNKSRS